MKYKRILLKLSGEALLGKNGDTIDHDIVAAYAKEIKMTLKTDTQVAIVIGGGNIFRGAKGEKTGIDRTQGDNMGMLATVINGLAIQSALEKIGIETRVQSAIEIKSVCESYIRRRAIRHLEKKRVVIFVAGTGSPFFTTDSAATLRAIEIKADIVLKGTRVDGVYTADPEKDKTATKFESLKLRDAMEKNLGVMDMTAFALCNENKMPIIVFDMNKPGNLYKIATGVSVGTLVEA